MCVGAFSKPGEIDEETVVLSHAIRMIMADANFFQLDFFYSPPVSDKFI